MLENIEPFPLVINEDNTSTKVYDAYKEQNEIFHVVKIKDHEYRLAGERIERTYSLINISTDEGLMRLMTYLRKIDVEKALKEAGAVDGDTVLLCDFEFEYFE